MNIAIEFEQFMKMLHELDNMMDETGLCLHIRAIGGFAMIYHGKSVKQHHRHASVDIDHLGEDFHPDIQTMIEAVAKSNGVQEDWLNNQWWRAKNGEEEFSLRTNWEDIGGGFKNLTVEVADIESLFMMKLRAVDDKLDPDLGETQPPRQQDVQDLVFLANMMGSEKVHLIPPGWCRNNMKYFPLAVEWFEKYDL